MIKLVLFFCVFCGTFVSQAQTFSFVNNSTTLIKTTDQSPAHWYIEITNDLGLDTALRWKAIFEDVPSQWQINFDYQTTSHPDVNHGDSSDFALPITGTFPQKLIIGATLNNTPADATIHFEIYDPYAPAGKDTISYIFIVTQGSANLNELVKEGIISVKGDVLSILNQKKTSILIHNSAGKLIEKKDEITAYDLKELPLNQILFIQLSQGAETYIVKIKR